MHKCGRIVACTSLGQNGGMYCFANRFAAAVLRLKCQARERKRMLTFQIGGSGWSPKSRAAVTHRTDSQCSVRHNSRQ